MTLLPHFTRAHLLRAVALWVAVRLCVAAISMVAAGLAERPPPPHPFAVTHAAAVLVIAIVAAAGWVFAHLRNEDLFLMSLGYGRLRPALVSAVAPLLLEIAAEVASRA